MVDKLNNSIKMYKEQPKPIGHTLEPVNIGSSVMALKYKDGIMIAADTAISYGSMKKTKHA